MQCETIVGMVKQMITRTYTELITLSTFEERYKYLRLGGKVGEDTFGFDRYLNQIFYKSKEWLSVRNEVITRDLGCDLGCTDHEIPNGVTVLIHHMNPITKSDILDRTELLLNPEFLITTIKRTHDAIHYGDDSFLLSGMVERTKNDTCLWK